MENTGKAVMISTFLGKIASIIGYTGGVLALFIIILGITDMGSEGAVTAMIFFVFILACCIFLIYQGIRIKKRISRFYKYISIISTNQITPLAKIAASTSQSVDFVRDDLQKMIDKRFFVRTHIDMDTDEIVINWHDGADFIQDSRTELEPEAGDDSGSGVANTEPTGKPESCEYIEYAVTKEDLLSAYAHDLKKPALYGCLLYYFAFYLVAMIFGGVFILLSYLDAPTPTLLFFIFTMLTAVVLFAVRFSRRSRATRIVKGKLKRGEIEPQYFGRHRLTLKDDVIEMQYGTVCIRRQYDGINKTVEYACGIIICNSELDRDIIPDSVFVDRTKKSEFINHLQAKIAQAKNIGVSERNDQEHEQETRYVLKYTWEEESFIAAMIKASRLLYKNRLFWTTGQIIMTLAGLFLIIAGIVEISGLFRKTISPLHIGVCLGIGIAFLSPIFMAFTSLGKMRYRRQIDSGAISRDFFNPQSLCVKDDRITQLCSLSSFDVMYDRVYCVRHDADGMYILLTDKRVLIIPNSAFSSDERKSEIADYIEKKIKGD